MVGEEVYRIMLFECPVAKFKEICEDYPQTYKWMAQRALMRRNYFMKIQKTLYERHNVEAIWATKSHLKDIKHEEILRCQEKVLRNVTEQSRKINFDPYNYNLRKELLENDFCTLTEDYET